MVQAGVYRADPQSCAQRKLRPTGVRGAARDEQRSIASSLSRSRTKLRRTIVDLRANRMISLTFADEPTLDEAWEAVETFRRRWEAAGYGKLVMVPEYGDKNGRLHFHGACAQYVPKEQLAAMWCMGFVDIRMIRAKGANRRVTASTLETARVVAGYLAGYLGKGSTAPGAPEVDPPTEERSGESSGASGAHRPAFNRRRYSVSKGAPVRCVRLVSFGWWEAMARAHELLGARGMHVQWTSDEAERWQGLPTWLLVT